MRDKTVCFVPLISVSFSEDWESDDDSSLNDARSQTQECGAEHERFCTKSQHDPPTVSFSEDCKSDDDSRMIDARFDMQDCDVKHQTLSTKAQYDPSPKSIEEKKIFLKKETGKKRLCRSCKLNKSKEHFVYTDTTDNDKIKTKNSKFNVEKTTRKDDYLQASEQFARHNGGDKNEAKQLDDIRNMKPVPASVRKHIYKGISHEGNGRIKYLQMRYHTTPEDRWHHPETSSMHYGWNWGYPPEIKCPEYGRKMIVYHSFFRPNDINLKLGN